jgi:hypothetical protein
MEREMVGMRNEIESLRSRASLQLDMSSHPFQSGPAQIHELSHHLASPLSAVSQAPPSGSYPVFIQGCSSEPLGGHVYYSDVSMGTHAHQQEMALLGPPSLTSSPSSSHSNFHTPFAEAGLTGSRKRVTPGPSSDADSESSDADSFEPPERPLKRKNHHDTRCLTIHVRNMVQTGALDYL